MAPVVTEVLSTVEEVPSVVAEVPSVVEGLDGTVVLPALELSCVWLVTLVCVVGTVVSETGPVV